MRHSSRIAGAIATLALLFAFSDASAQDAAPERATGWTPKTVATAKTYMAASAHPLASDAGAAVLKEGGSAVDAAIAMQLVLNLVEPQSSGLGGGAFAVLWDKARGRVLTYDARETAPASATPALFLDPATGKPLAFYDAVIGGKSTGVPGVPLLLTELHHLYGRLPWARLIQPALDLANDGFPVSTRLSRLIAADKYLGLDPIARNYFFRADGSPRQPGEKLANPAFAETLEIFKAEGAGPFYRGNIARDIVGAVARDPNPGHLTADDLSNYRVISRDPVCAPYRASWICGMGPPSSGAVTVSQILGLLEPQNLKALDPKGATFAHLFTQAQRLAFADRDLYLADPAFVPAPLPGLLDPGYLAERAKLVDPARSLDKALPGAPPGKRADLSIGDTPELPATSHIAVIDRDGNAVSMTTTIESAFGSRRMVRGYLLNNELTDFSFLPERDGKPVANRVEAAKRPRSSMTPSLVFDEDGHLQHIVGSVGGSAIIGYVAQTLIGLIDFGLDPQAAADLPHIGNRNGPGGTGRTELEADTAAVALKPALEALGHSVAVVEFNSGTQAISIKDGLILGGADARRDGTAAGD